MTKPTFPARSGMALAVHHRRHSAGPLLRDEYRRSDLHLAPSAAHAQHRRRRCMTLTLSRPVLIIHRPDPAAALIVRRALTAAAALTAGKTGTRAQWPDDAGARRWR